MKIKSVPYVVWAAFVVAIVFVAATLRFVFVTTKHAGMSKAIENQASETMASAGSAVIPMATSQLGNEAVFSGPCGVSRPPTSGVGLKSTSGTGKSDHTVPLAIAAKRVPLEESPLAPVDPQKDGIADTAFNQAAAVLRKTLKKLDKSSIFSSYNGVYALAVSGRTFILASSDGTVVIFQQSDDGQLFETSSGTACPFIARKDNYYLARLAAGAYVLTTPSGEEYTLGGAQNAEDDRKPFSSSPVASPLMAVLAAVRGDLPRDHELFTTPDKGVAVVSAFASYIMIKSDGARSVIPAVSVADYRLVTDAGMTCVVVAGDQSASVGKPTPELLVVKNADGTETVLPKTADASEYEAVVPSYRDLSAIPPDLISDPPYTPGRLVYTDLINRNEWELSLSEQRVRRRLLAEMSSDDPSASSL